MISGIYAIENIYNNKVYVGSSIDIENRWNRHKKDLIKNRHHNIFMQRSYRKYGENCFVYFILEKLDTERKELIKEKEQYWIDLVEPEYNIGGVSGGDTFSKNPRKEEIRKIHTENLTKLDKSYLKLQTGDKNPNWRGATHTTCVCGNKKSWGNKVCKECLDRSGNKNSFYGKTHTEEVRKVISEKNKGRPSPTRKRVLYGGIIYDSALEASNILGLKMVTLAYRCRNNLYGFCYVDENLDITKCIDYSTLSEEERIEIPKCDYRARMN